MIRDPYVWQVRAQDCWGEPHSPGMYATVDEVYHLTALNWEGWWRTPLRQALPMRTHETMGDLPRPRAGVEDREVARLGRAARYVARLRVARRRRLRRHFADPDFDRAIMRRARGL